jgi:hypothetical protein
MSEIVSGMVFIASRGQKVQRIFQQYFIIDDDDNVVANHQSTVGLLRLIPQMKYLTYNASNQ